VLHVIDALERSNETGGWLEVAPLA